MSDYHLAERIREKALELGFLDCGIVPAGFLAEEAEHFRDWLARDLHGEMSYMARNIDKRLDPTLLHEGTRTIIVVLQNYYPSETQKDPEAPVISKYAYGTDYHFVMKEKLNDLLRFIQGITPCTGRPFVDSAPVLDRAWARKAGLGWVGKNANLISLQHGSFFFIGELMVDIYIPHPEPESIRDHCGRCTRCIDACPTGAIVSDRVIDARKCISYQTIELRGDLDESLKGRFENRVFGCDICQDVCPWNLKSSPHKEPALEPRQGLLEMLAEEWHSMEKSRFNSLFKSSAVQRTGYKGLLRNLKFIRDGHD